METRRDLVRGVDQPAGGVDHEHHRGRAILFPIRDDAVDVPRGDGVDLVLDLTDQDGSGPVRAKSL